MKLLGLGTAMAGPNIFGPLVPKEHHRSAVPDSLEKVGKDVKRRPSDDGWLPLEHLPVSYQAFIIDTRDFYNKPYKHQFLDLPFKVKKHPEKYYHSLGELTALVNHLYKESGGPGSWRMLSLEGQFRTRNWELKYMHIYHYNEGYLVCNSENFVFTKLDLYSPVDQKHLHHIKYEEE